MGCDIHFHIEVKINNKWEHFSHPHFERSYFMFSLLAGVRSNNDFPKPFKEADNKLPSKMNVITKIDLDCSDYHSYCSYNQEEIQSFYEYIESDKIKDLYRKDNPKRFHGYLEMEHNYIGYMFGNGWDPQYKEDWPKEIQEIRWVFAFDN